MFAGFQSCATSFLKCEEGATAIEYALIAVAMAMAIITSFPAISNAVKGKFSSVTGYFALL